jgi:hypothetical protein
MITGDLKRKAPGAGPGAGEVHKPEMEKMDDIDLNKLNDEELTEQIQDDLYDGLEDEVVEGVKILLARKWTPYDV